MIVIRSGSTIGIIGKYQANFKNCFDTMYSMCPINDLIVTLI
jgi:hypothetical protein